MSGRDIGRLVTPNSPGAKSDLQHNQPEPEVRKFPQKAGRFVLSPNEEAKTTNRQTNDRGDKAMRHLQPDLAGGNVGKAWASRAWLIRAIVAGSVAGMICP